MENFLEFLLPESEANSALGRDMGLKNSKLTQAQARHSLSPARAFLRAFFWLAFCLDAYIWMIVLRIIISWIVPYPESHIIRLAIVITEPGLHLLQEFIPPRFIFGMYLSDVLILAGLVSFLGLKFILLHTTAAVFHED